MPVDTIPEPVAAAFFQRLNARLAEEFTDIYADLRISARIKTKGIELQYEEELSRARAEHCCYEGCEALLKSLRLDCPVPERKPITPSRLAHMKKAIEEIFENVVLDRAHYDLCSEGRDAGQLWAQSLRNREQEIRVLLSLLEYTRDALTCVENHEFRTWAKAGDLFFDLLMARHTSSDDLYAAGKKLLKVKS
jgi:hypothetical protein